MPGTNQRVAGSVKWFSDEKGYGFLSRADGGPDVFIHYTALPKNGGRRTLTQGQKVEFDVVQGGKGPAAANVVVVE